MADRRIAHLDMDAFFASVELLRYPELRGQAAVVGGRTRAPERQDDGSWRFPRLRDYVGRGVITTATYPARALGVHSGMGLMKAAQLAPDAVLLPADFESYRRLSRQFKDAVLTVVPQYEDRGIDEIYLDLGDAAAEDGDDGTSVARRLKAAVREATGLTCSIAVAPNKLLAKIGSDLDKPDGLTLLTMDDLESRIWPLPVRRINGIGPKAGARLQEMGIVSIGDLAAAERALLVERFGPSTGGWMHEAAHGRDARPLVLEREPKSISRETTFGRDLHAVRDRGELGAVLDSLCTRLAGDLQRKGYLARTVGIKLRYDDFRIVTRDESLDAPIADAASIRRACGQCLKRVDLSRRLRLLGVRTAALVPAAGEATRMDESAGGSTLRGQTLPLFDDADGRITHR
jgi:DNA polymerase-4